MQRSRCSDHDAASSRAVVSSGSAAGSGARAVVQRRSESAQAMPDPATRRPSGHSAEWSQQCAAVDLVSGFVRDSIAARNCTNADLLDSYYRRTAAWCSSKVWQRGSKAIKGSSKSRPKEGSAAWEGCVNGRNVSWQAFWEPAKNPHELSRTLLRLFQSVGGLYSPQGHPQRRPKTFRSH